MGKQASRKRPREEAAEEADAAPFELKVLSESKIGVVEAKPLDRGLLKSDGKDIVKKSSTRKGRYLLAFAGQLAAVSAGKLGTLAQLDSQTPVLYLDCPGGGRIKMFGRLTFLRNKYITLRVGAKQAWCEDVFDMLVLFTTAWWVGTKEENPEEKQLPFPDSVLAAEPEPGAADPLDPLPMPGVLGTAAQRRSRSRSRSLAEDGDDSSDDEVELTQAPLQPLSQAASLQLRSSRRSSGKNPSYAEAAESEEASSQEDRSQSPGPAQQQRPAKPAQHAAADSPKQQARQKSAAQQNGTGPSKQPNGQRRKPASSKKTAKAATISLLSSDSDGEPAAPEDQPEPATEQRRPAGRAAKVAAAKVLVLQSQQGEAGQADSSQESSADSSEQDDNDEDYG